MVYPNGRNNLSMVGTIQDQEGDSDYQNINMDQNGPKSRMRQKAGEIQAFRTLERGVEKWCKEHTQRRGTDPISEEGRNLLEDTERWCDQASLLKECCESRKRERIHEDGSFRHHQIGPITATYTEGPLSNSCFFAG